MSKTDSVDWEKIVPVFIHRAFGSTSSISGFLSLIDFSNTEKSRDYLGKALKGVNDFQAILRELSYLSHEPAPDDETVDISKLVLAICASSPVFTMLKNPRPIMVTGDLQMATTIFDLFRRLLTVGSWEKGSITIAIDGNSVIFNRKYVELCLLDKIDGNWGFEKTLLFYLVEKNGWTVTSSVDDQQETITLGI
jgi:hypothetical protein